MALAMIAAAFSDFPLLLADPIATSGCPLGGSARRICAAVGFPREITATFADCRIPAPGGSLALTGSVRLSAQTGSCPGTLLGDVTQAVNLTLVYRDDDGAVRRAVTADLTAAIAEHRGLNTPCLYTGVTASLQGAMEVLLGSGLRIRIDLRGLQVAADVSASTSHCLPFEDRRTFAGTAAIVDPLAQRVFPLSFSSYELQRLHTADGVEIAMMGAAGGACFGGGSAVGTAEAMRLPLGDICPDAGTIFLLGGDTAGRTFFYSSGALQVDSDGDGMADEDYPTCRSGPGCG